MKSVKIIISILVCISILISTPFKTKASSLEGKNTLTLTLGENLTDEQCQLIFNYLQITEDSVNIITVTNEDERRYLEGIIDSSKIGTKTYSCSLIQPTESGGIHVKTVNLTYVTCDMLRNALITSGINNCNIIAVSPIEVSGTGSLTGIFKAYEQVSGEELSEEKKELASQELVTTIDLANNIGQDNATTLLSNLKESVIVNNTVDKDEIANIISKYISEHNIKITEEQKWQLVDFLLNISQQEYNIEEVKTAYNDIKQTVNDIKEAADKTKNIFQKIGEFFKDLWAKISGTYDEIKETEECQMISEQLGILTQTNESLLGDETVVTITEDESIIEEIKEDTKQSEDNKEINQNQENWQDSPEINEITFEDFSTINEEQSNNGSDAVIFEDLNPANDTENSGMLQYVIYHLQSLKLGETYEYKSSNIDDNTDNQEQLTQSFDQLTK